ncbi:MAG: TetR/AcrR family transcriptional regulator [Lachnospiraceae bacterium]|nr:TetR/AcrR family transcriptional regulator [Lachnospiraceae bacterium]
MNEKFFDLAREKQDRMINGAIEVFAKNGYKHAATDDMVKAVGVSKGLWFHYFGSKEGIYVFVYDYSVKYTLLELSAVVDESVTDYFEMVRQIEQAKARVRKSYPYMSDFLKAAEHETDEAIMQKTAEVRQIYRERMNGLLKGAEIEGISDRTRRERIKKILEHSLEGMIREKRGADPDAVYREVKAYIDLIRNMSQGLIGQTKNEPIASII